MPTNVPKPTFGPTGLIVPTEQAILAGAQADINASFGGNVNAGLSTPQGQMAVSEAAVIAQANAQFLAIVNGIDPAYAAGRMQDGIGRIYMMSRIQAIATSVIATCTGLAGTLIPIGALAIDKGGSIYAATAFGTIPTPAVVAGSITATTLTITGVTSGVVAQWQNVTGTGVAPGTVITAQLSGITGGAGTYSVNNSHVGTGAITITTSGVGVSFANTVTGPIACPAGFLNTIYRSIPGWDTVLNTAAGVAGNNVESRADFETRRQSSVAANAQGTYSAVLASVLSVPNVIDAYVLGNPLGVTSGASITGSIAGTPSVLTVATVVSGTVAIGQMITGAGVAPGTYITGGSGITWSVNINQGVSLAALTCAQGGYPLKPHSIYVGVSGGTSTAVAQAIWNKVSPGCDYNGNTTVSVQDKTPPYVAPFPTYAVVYNTLTPTPVSIAVTLLNNANVPSDAASQIQNAVIATFTGANGSPRARAGATIMHSSLYAPLFALGSWVQIVDLALGIGTANRPSLLMQIDQEPTIVASNIAVTFQ
jgi:hypothetical protein